MTEPAAHMAKSTLTDGDQLNRRQTPIIVRHIGMRSLSAEQVIDAVGGLSSFGIPPIDFLIDTKQFADDVESGHWGPSHGEVWRRAREIKDRLDVTPDARLIYAGASPEVAHAIAFGAYLEDQWLIEAYDFHDGVLTWPAKHRSLDLGSPDGLPLDRMTKAGPAVLRVEISYRISDDQVREFVREEEQVAEIRIAPLERDPAPGIIRSQGDVDEVRRAVRVAIATLVDRRPNLTVLHLFVAAPVSACVVVGQELRLRNHPPVQTYQHRRRPDGTSATTEAIRLTSGGPTVVDIPLTPEQAERASALRSELWMPAIKDVERYADRKQREAQRAGRERTKERWYDGLPWSAEFQRVHPFSALPPVYQVSKRPSSVDPHSFEGDGFGFLRTNRVWRVNDGFSIRLADRFPDLQTARSLVRIFLFHEYLHEVHGITKESYREVGKFPNALERADYMCDLYGILHELDWESDANQSLGRDFDRLRTRVAELIDLVIRSYWAFEPPAPLEWMEIRRMRRYMNWYWQQVRILFTETPFQLAAVLARQPIVELAGMATRAEGRRLLASLRRVDRGVGLELCVVLDNERLARIKTGVNTRIEELVYAFRNQDHTQIGEFFRRVFAEAESLGHTFPSEDQVP